LLGPLPVGPLQVGLPKCANSYGGTYPLISAHGADVLLVTSPRLPSLPIIDVDTSRGKRTTQLDLTIPSDHEKLKHLASTADVFLQAYRPGGLEAKGFGSRELASLRPGIVTANLTAWGWDGPWKDRRGVERFLF
jgi:crotonobetainyl-CoA:carnitine CoA-transferase CaiB-like acyl-CoA transferase